MSMALPPPSRLDVIGYPAYHQPHRLGFTLGNIRPPTVSSSSPAADTSSHGLSPSPVVIACRPCRGRKIRCDSTRPSCANCLRRKSECIYDAAPKRRGPDKRPGTRQRSCKKRSARSSTTTADEPASPEDTDAPPAKRQRIATPPPASAEDPPAPTDGPTTTTTPEAKTKPKPMRNRNRISSDASSQRRPSSPSVPLRITTDLNLSAPVQSSPLSPGGSRPVSGHSIFSMHPLRSSHPSQLSPFAAPKSAVESSQGAWWRSFLQEYPLNDIISDLTFVFGDTGYWLSFLNLPSLLQMLWSAEDRAKLPPAFVLAALALAELMRSSEMERGAAGRARAAGLRQSAQAALDRAVDDPEIDYRLAEAALILVLYESCAHPSYHLDRISAALQTLDAILDRLNLFQLDSHDVSVSRFVPHCPPIVYLPPPPHSPSQSHRPFLLARHEQQYPRRTCHCNNSPGSAPRPPDNTIFCATPLRWNPTWSAAETRTEECRRLVWSSLGAASAFMVQCAAFESEAPALRMTGSTTYALLFPGEVSDRISPAYFERDAPSPKASIWALYCRSLLLWNFSHRLARSAAIDPDSDAPHETWNEAQAIEDSLEMHVCNYDTGIVYLCQEFIHNTRMSVTQALRRIHGLAREMSTTPGPLINRRQAVEWIDYQAQVVKSVKFAVHQANRRGLQAHTLALAQQHPLTRRPYQVAWFLNQLSVCMQIWTHDTALADAVALGKDLLAVMDVLNAWWPCEANRAQTDSLRKQLIHACAVIGSELPVLPFSSDVGLGRL
ncbi:hypothetical protein C8F01DRAFT_1192069 [Mycena amicta]|nr:hypothetical protein C8F01DRAFT_1192069 [Mycena amicta]